MVRPGLWTRQLLYGPFGSGKSAYAVSSFWDWKNKTKLRNGRWITVGQEDNKALGVPEEMRVRLTSPSLNNNRFVSDLNAFTLTALKDAQAGKYSLDSIVFDGMSEFDLLWEGVYNQGHPDEDKFKKWDALLNECFNIMQRLDPNELGCHVLFTARVMEKKKAVQVRGAKAAGGDPDYIDFDYYPSLRGSFRLHFPYYFDIVAYVEQKLRFNKETKENEPEHVFNMIRTGDYEVKNNWEYGWLKAGHPTSLINPSFDDVLKILEKLNSG